MMDRHKLMIKMLNKITLLHLKILDKLYQLIKIHNKINLSMMDKHKLKIKIRNKIFPLHLKIMDKLYQLNK